MDCGIEVADSNADWSKGRNETEQILKKKKFKFMGRESMD